MTPNPSPEEQELIAIELSEFAADIIEAISKPYNDGPKAVAALLHGRLTNLKHSYAEEARRAPQHAKAGDDFSWPVVDRIDLHLPSYPAPSGKAHIGLDGDIAVWWDGECYRAYQRKTKQIRVITDPSEIADIKEELERVI